MPTMSLRQQRGTAVKSMLKWHTSENKRLKEYVGIGKTRDEKLGNVLLTMSSRDGKDQGTKINIMVYKRKL